MCRQSLVRLGALVAFWLVWTATTATCLVAPTGALAQDLVQAMPLSIAQAPAAPPILSQPTLPVDPAAAILAPPTAELTPTAAWTWQVVPEGILYPSYLAGPNEPRIGSQWFHDTASGNNFWDLSLGGRAGLIRYGTTDPSWPEGWQLDVEGAAFPRLTLDHDRDLVSADFRGGFPLTFRQGLWESKFGYYHLSSHLGDEYMLKYDDWERFNYSRDALVFGLALRPNRDWRLYGEVGWAFWADGGAEPWEFQFGASFAPGYPTGFQGAPFAAVNTHLFQENNFGGNVSVQAGWAWRGATGHLLRTGLHYLNGRSNLGEFYRQFEQQVGAGVWYDF